MARTAATIDVLLRANTAAYRAEMVSASRAATRSLGQIQRSAESTTRTFELMKRAAVGVFSVRAISAVSNSLLTVTKQQQALVNSMRASVGSAAQSGAALDFVSQVAKELGLNYQSAAEGFQRLTASATANGIAMRDQQQLFLEVSRAATSMQIAPAQVDRAMTALSQSFSKGRFMAEELRQQLAEAIPGVVPRFQKAVLELTKGTDLAGKSFDELLQGGLLDVKTFLPAMTRAFAEMGTTWREGASSLQAESNRLGNAWRELKLELAKGPFSDTAVAGIRATTSALEGMGAVMPILAPAAGSLAVALASVAAIKGGERLAEWTRGLNAAYAATLQQKLAAEQAAAALVAKTRAELLDAEATAARARAAYGGSIAADVAAVEATNAHTRALKVHQAAQLEVAAASNRLALAGKAALGFFGGPVGLAATIALTAGSWLYFRNSTREAERALLDFNGAADATIAKFKELNRQQQAGEVLRLNRELREGYEEIDQAIAQMTNTISGFGMQAGVGFVEYQKQAAALQAEFKRGQISADQFAEKISNLNGRAIEGVTVGGWLKDSFIEQEAALGTVARGVEEQQGLLKRFAGAQQAAAAAARGHAQDLDTLGNSAKGATDKILASLQSLPGQIERVGKAADRVAALDVRDWFRALAKDGVKFDNRQDAAIQKYIAQGAAYIALVRDLDAAQKRVKTASSTTDADYTQSLIRNAKARQQEYQLELAAGDNLTESKRALLKFELELKDTKNASLQAASAYIRAILKENVSLEEQRLARARLLEQQQRELTVARQIADFMASMDRQHSRDLAAITGGGREAEWLGIASSVSDQFRSQRLDIDRDHQNRLTGIPLEDMARRNEEQQQYLALLGKTAIAEAEALAKARQYYEEILAAQSDWTNGARRAFEDYTAMAEDIAGQTYDIFTNAFRGLEDVLTEFITKGQADWKGFFDSLAAEITRFLVRQQLSKWMRSMFGGGDMGGESAGTIFDLFSGSGFGFAAGGYTGPGGRNQPAGVVHRGEVVWSQQDVARAGGVATVEAMRLGRRGYGDGGAVDVPVRVGSAVTGGSGVTQNVQFLLAAPTDPRTQSQIANRMAFETGRAARRNN